MAFDISRSTFQSWKDYFGVVMEQGRVQTDADWNEWVAEVSRRIQAGTLDILGHAVYPATTPAAFQITATTTNGVNSVQIGCGRMYVDGLLAENHGVGLNSPPFDPALTELSGAPQPPPVTALSIDYANQPYIFPATTPFPTGSGPFLAYLDVWLRPVIYLQDDCLIDKAIDVDTSGRVQLVWQVKLMPVPSGQAWTCATPNSDLGYPSPSAGLLSSDVVANPPSGPCCLTTNSGYTGFENQLYRVEIHDGGQGGDSASPSGATFKWSRENASVATGVTNIASGANSLNQPAFKLTVLSLGRDQVLGFAPGNWIELLDESLDLANLPGEIYQIDGVDVTSKTITLTKPLASGSHFTVGKQLDTALKTRIRRWDQSGVVYKADGKTPWCDLSQDNYGGLIPVPAADTTLILENGVVVTFSLNPNVANGAFNAGDYWIFAARTADGKVEKLASAPPRGIYHHYAKLSILSFSPVSNPDCRVPWSPGSGGGTCCCSVTVAVGDGQQSAGQFTSIQQAIQSLPAAGGEVCILPGRYFENIVIDGRADVVIRGCGALTRLASASLAPGATTTGPAPSSAKSGLPAVITISGSRRGELASFCIEAADGECGVLLDFAAPTDRVIAQNRAASQTTLVEEPFSSSDIAIRDLVVVGSKAPAILANDVELLEIIDNRLATKNYASPWSTVRLGGREIHFERNWVGLLSAASKQDWIPPSVVDDLAPGAVGPFRAANESTELGNFPGAPGGVQIVGPSTDVYVCENEIEGGSRNGVTLGGFIILDANSGDSGIVTGVVDEPETQCATTATFLIPATSSSGANQGQIVAGGDLTNVLIEGNRIRNMGLCGVGPVGFFDLSKAAEAIGVQNLTIRRNAIESTLQRELASPGAAAGFGVICLADVANLFVCDNEITDFGAAPGAANACGIFVLLAEMSEISRNRIRETRDFAADWNGKATTSELRGGVVVVFAVPPATAAQDVASYFEPGLSALRVEHNVVRVALGDALAVAGLGPFSIINNHFASGWTMSLSGLAPAMTVFVLNLGGAIEFVDMQNSFASFYASRANNTFSAAGGGLANSSSGAVLFTNNICQLEARVGGQRGVSSVFVASRDNLIFANNHCWLDAPGRNDGDAPQWPNAALDALLIGAVVQVTGNRFQEALGSVLASGWTYGAANITSLNFSTYCLYATAPEPSYLQNVNNLSAFCATISPFA